MRAYTLPQVMPFTSCWRNSLTARRPGSTDPRRGRLLRETRARGSSGRLDARVVDLLAVLDLDDHGRLRGVAVLIERDRPGDAGVLAGAGDQVAQRLVGRLPVRAPRLARAEVLEDLGLLRGQPIERAEQHVGRIV